MGQVFAMISCGDNPKKLAKLLLDPNSMGEGGKMSCDAKFSENCPFYHYDNTNVALVMTNT